jgi:hypothetical protein
MSSLAPATDLESRVARLRAMLDRHRRSLSDRAPREGAALPDPAIAELLGLIRTLDDREAFAELERDGTVAAHRACFGPRMLAFIAATEERVRTDLLAGGHNGNPVGMRLRANPWGAYRGTEETVAAIDLSACRRLAMIGCGPLPDTLLYLHEHTAIDALVGIEHERHAADRARTLVDRFGLDRIEILEQDGTQADYAGFDVVFVSVFAQPRAEVIARVAGTADAGALVILRDPMFTGRLLFESVLGRLPERFELRARARSHPGSLMLARYVLAVGPGVAAAGGQAATVSSATASRNERSRKPDGTSSR